MSPDVIAIITVGVGLGGLMVAVFQSVNERLDSLERRFDIVEQRQARLEGLMEGIRDLLAERVPLSQ